MFILPNIPIIVEIQIYSTHKTGTSKSKHKNRKKCQVQRIRNEVSTLDELHEFNSNIPSAPS